MPGFPVKICAMPLPELLDEIFSWSRVLPVEIMIFRGHRYLSHSGKRRVNFREKGDNISGHLGALGTAESYALSRNSLLHFSADFCYRG
jgi:hypothetical protein